MNATGIGIVGRAVGLALILALAAASGLVAGNLIQGRADNNAGYPDGWQGGAAVPVTRTANAAFSLDAISAVQAARGDAAAETDDYVDYAQRHAPAEAEDYVDYGVRHAAAAADADSSAEKKSLAKPTVR